MYSDESSWAAILLLHHQPPIVPTLHPYLPTHLPYQRAAILEDADTKKKTKVK